MTEKRLEESFKRHSRSGDLYEYTDDGDILCYACGHECVIKEGRSGVCNVRFNEEGELLVPYDYTAGLQVDPVEKKPFFHVAPGTNVLSFGMLGCDFQCGYCQNWVTSQSLRNPDASTRMQTMSAEELVDRAQQHGVTGIVSTYNEPLITSEWARAVFEEARDRDDFLCGFVSNGNATERALDYLEPYSDLYKVDLKSFRDETYRRLGGVLKNTLETIEMLHKRDFWLEVVTLIVPDFNDDEEEWRDMARFLAEVSPDIPWHVTAFHPDYEMQDHTCTRAEMLRRAATIGKEEGLNYVYVGNMPGQIEDLENTYCPGCDNLLIERYGHRVIEQRVTPEGTCPDCNTDIPGVWSEDQSQGRMIDPTNPDPFTTR